MTPPGSIRLEAGATVAVIGGGPAGAFFAIHLLRKARDLRIDLKVVIFERRRASSLLVAPGLAEEWKGCNYCAGGISPRLQEVLAALELELPEAIIQSHIRSITIQGYWKNIELEAPPGREILSVFRGSRPDKRLQSSGNFDSFLLDQALKAGAGLVAGEVLDVGRNASGKPLLHYRASHVSLQLEADLAVFAAGVNEEAGLPASRSRMLQSLQRLIPKFAPPRIRQALIFELEARPALPPGLMNTLNFVEYGSKALPLEMCSLIPKRGFLTVVLVGESVDQATSHGETQQVMRQFLELPHIRDLVSSQIHFSSACVCRPNMVIGSAEHPFADRVAAVGDLVTTRLYKDGILSAHQTAQALADTVLARGIDAASLQAGYAPTLRRFKRDNRFAALVFLLHRLFFGSSILSRVLYQAVISERKTTPGNRRRLEKILWRIASGDDDYRDVFGSMVHPATVASILAGVLTTLRNYLTELLFGLRWEGFGRFTTGVAIERLEEKRRQFARLIFSASVALPEKLEFERMYTIKIGAPREAVLEQLGRFGEPGRGYLKPRWVKIQRVAGLPNAPGCAIRYEVIHPRFHFTLVLEQLVGGHLAVYRVQDGFAQGGVLIFEIEELAGQWSALSIYVAFDFIRGQSTLTRPVWSLFRWLFPSFVHDVLWNHSLCQFKHIVETPADSRAP